MTFVRIFLITCICLVATTTKATPQTFLVMGDSLSAAYGINLNEGWVNLLHQEFSKKKQANIINASVSGETTSGGLARLPALLSQYKPQIVVIELGANDGLRGQSLKLMRNNLQAMIAMSKDAGAQVLLVGMQIPTNYGSRYTQQFRETYSALAEQNKLTLVPFLLEGVATQPELMQTDRLHPNAKAQTIIADYVKPYFKKMLSVSTNWQP